MHARDLVWSAPKGGTDGTACVQGDGGLPPGEARPDGCTGATPSHKLVLVVGDDAAAQGSLAELLVRAGYGLMLTSHARDVLRLALEYRPAVILLHLTLGATSTLDILRALQADARARRIPIVVLSASAWPLLTPEAEGARVLWHGPLRPRRLLVQLATLIGEPQVPGAGHQGPGPARTHGSLTVAPGSPAPADGSAFLARGET